MKTIIPKLVSSRKSFNLVELSLAIAVVAIGVVSVFGILPHILKSSRQAVDYSAITLLAQDVVDDPEFRGLLTPVDLSIMTNQPPRQVGNSNFIATETIQIFTTTNANSSLGPTPLLYTNATGSTRPLLKTIFITYRWGNVNSPNQADIPTYTFVTETAATEDISAP